MPIHFLKHTDDWKVERRSTAFFAVFAVEFTILSSLGLVPSGYNGGKSTIKTTEADKK